MKALQISALVFLVLSVAATVCPPVEWRERRMERDNAKGGGAYFKAYDVLFRHSPRQFVARWKWQVPPPAESNPQYDSKLSRVDSDGHLSDADIDRIFSANFGEAVPVYADFDRRILIGELGLHYLLAAFLAFIVYFVASLRMQGGRT